MGKETNRLRARKEAKKQFDAINTKRELTLVIHYSCESFYDIQDGRTPRVTSIAVRNLASGQTASFSIHKSAEQKSVPTDQITNCYDELEYSMLEAFFKYLLTVPTQTFVHWNMRDVNYGFQAIEHRYKALGGKPVFVEDLRKFDLARELITLYGARYVPHGKSGRMHSLMDINCITAKDALTGADEAVAFENMKYVKLHQSTLRKVDVIANLFDRTLDGSLRTKSNWRERHGIHPVALLEISMEHWIWALIAAISVILSIFGFLTSLLG